MSDFVIAVVQTLPRTPGKPRGWMPPAEALQEAGVPYGVCVDWRALREHFTEHLPRQVAEEWRN